ILPGRRVADARARRRRRRARDRAAHGPRARRRRARRVAMLRGHRGRPARRRGVLLDRRAEGADRLVGAAVRAFVGWALMPVYLDWNAGTPPHPDVLGAQCRAASEAWANPASVHTPGRHARALIEEAREAVAQLLGFEARDVVLTSGGTEANNLALRSF